MYKLFLVYRYLSRRLLSVVAIVVLACAVWVLVLAPSVMSGFQYEFRKRLRGTLSDLTLSTVYPHSLDEDRAIERWLRGFPHVEAIAPYLDNPALDKHLRKIDYCFLRGIDPAREEKVTALRSYFLTPRAAFKQMRDYDIEKDPDKRARLDAEAESYPDEVDVERIYEHLTKGHPDEPDLPTVIVGVYYLKHWDLRWGHKRGSDTIRLTTASQEGEVNKDREFRVVGAFRSGHHETDRRLIVMSLKNLQTFLNVPGKISGYSVRLTDHELATDTQDAIRKDMPGPLPVTGIGGYYLQTWQDRNKNLLNAVQMEKALIRIMTFLIVIAAAASIFLVLFMTVHAKVRELGILRAVGATRSGVLLLFVGQGLLIALVAMGLGLVLGYATGANVNEIAAWQQQYTGWHPFPPEIYYLDQIPIRFDLMDNLQNFLITLGLGSVAALIPGLLAALRPPLKSIRYE